MRWPSPIPETLASAHRGERVAQQQLYDAFAPYVLGVCMRYSRDRPEADDMAQEAWVDAFGGLDSYSGDAPFGAWLRRVTVNRCLKVLRARRLTLDAHASHKLAEGEYPLPPDLHLEPEAISAMGAAEIVAHIAALPEGFRAVFNLVAIEGYSHAEAAAALGISASTSRSQLTRARTALQRRITSLIAVCL